VDYCGSDVNVLFFCVVVVVMVVVIVRFLWCCFYHGDFLRFEASEST
jgi:hypothetical protein